MATKGVTPEQAIDFIDEVVTVLNCTTDNEFVNVNATLEAQNKIKQLIAHREECIKSHIDGLTKECDERVEEVKNVESDSVFKAHIELERELKIMKDNQEKVNNLLEATLEKQKEVEREKKDVEDKKSSVKESNSQIPKLRHDASLFNYISSIRWQYDVPPNEIKGYVANGKNVRTFDLNTNLNSQFFITNYLWDAMETDW